MLNLESMKNLCTKHLLLILSAQMLMLASCTPTSTAPKLDSANNSSGTGNTTSGNVYPDSAFPLAGIFLQEGVSQSLSNFPLPMDFSDSFLVRGSAVSQFLRNVPSSTNFCFSAKFVINSVDEYLILSAKPKSYTDLGSKKTEFYLQVEPANGAANLADCSYMNLVVPDLTPSYSFSQLCANCTTSVSSSGLKLYQASVETPNLNVSLLNLTITNGTSSSGNLCSESITCQSKGYSCCLGSQCVNDGAKRPGADFDPGYAAAAEDVRLNPTHFLLYPQYYFVCDSRPVETEDPGTGVDPVYAAQVQLMELTQLYNCLNKVDGEFSHCTVKTLNATNTSTLYTVPSDDVTFKTILPGLPDSNIVKVIYAGKTIFDAGAIISGMTASAANDLLTTGQQITLSEPYPTTAQDKNLYLTYKVDGTCEKVSVTLAKCTKTYIYKSLNTSKTTYHDTSPEFLLPKYADLNSTDPNIVANTNIIVKVSGVTVPEDPTKWQRSQGKITFNYTLFQNQEIAITYFTSQGASVMASKNVAQTKVNATCACSGTINCNLKPILTAGSLTNYECTYPSTTTAEPPINQTVYVSNKNIPHRYYDTSGLSYDTDYSAANPQENAEFKYNSSNPLKPNNVGTNVYVGFNEIYGSFTKSDALSPRPAKMASVKKDRIYDIYVNSGSFSSCINCGTDYYSALQKIFPQNFAGSGGGYTPDKYESRRMNNATIYRSDDLFYGRACFIPAIMIPWTHKAAGTPKDQRIARLKGQHLLFANGYSRDWFGFDYGSIIGSFDGVNWFSVGNERRIKASTGKLFLAVNAYFGDQNVDSNFTVTVSESNGLTDIPDHDTETSGAECQKSHYCSNDNDCFRQLGYEYSCQSVGGVSTAWPQFDANGNEVVGSITKTVASIVGGTNGQAKRCAYRGRGAPCLADLLNANLTTFNSSSLIGTLACSSNNSCVSLGTPSRFNQKIARFAASPASQNAMDADPLAKSDTIGLNARIIGRPYNYYGKETVSALALDSGLGANNVSSICIPGRNISGATRTYDLNRLGATQNSSSDKLYGVGATMSGAGSTKYLNACPATDAVGISIQYYDLPLGDDVINQFTINQNLSSNLLDISPLNNPALSTNVFSSTNESQITTVGYQRNACLRAPGASCFSDLECAPSAVIADKVRIADLTGILTTAEKSYWQEDLVCGNIEFKNVNVGLNPNYDLKKNVCCREFGKTMTVFTQTAEATSAEWCDSATRKIKVAGVNAPLTYTKRYSRVHTGYDKMTCNPIEISSTKTFALSLLAANSVQRLLQIDRQFKTLDAINQRTCCTQNWVRSFHSENGGGHAWSKSKAQSVDKAMFKHISWNAQNGTLGVIDPAFECDPNHSTDSSCEIKSLTDAEKKLYLDWASSLELIGIPQAAIKTNDDIFQLVDDSQLNNVGTFSLTHTQKKAPLFNSVKAVNGTYSYVPGAVPEYTLSTIPEDFKDGTTGKMFYSGMSYDKFEMGAGKLKKVFSESEFNCCIPSGQEVPTTTTTSQCCTGYLANINGPLRCCLPDYTDVTLYLNRYVSSEGRGLSDSFYDKNTGYITDPGQVKLMASQKKLCCSGKAVTGVALSRMSIPITNGNYLVPATNLNTTERMNYRTDAVDNNTETKAVGSRVDAGVRWNNHVYCVPSTYNEN